MKRTLAIAISMMFSGAVYAGPALEQLGATGGEFILPAPQAIKAVQDSAGLSSTPETAPFGFIAGGNNNGQQPQLPIAVKEWTVMVYLNGKSDLEQAILYNLNQMEVVGSGDSLNIVVEAGRMNGQNGDVNFDGNWTGSRRYYITKDTQDKADFIYEETNRLKIRSKVMQSFDRVDMGDWKHLADFARWGMKNYPAKHYALIIGSHGSGWLTNKKLVSKSISSDKETGNHISTPELGWAMKEIGKVDILSFDACLMQMAEVMYEVKNYADYIVGSEHLFYSTPFNKVLASFARPKSPGELAVLMVAAYEQEADDSYAVYQGTPYSPTSGLIACSAITMSALDDFMAAFNRWTDALLLSDKKRELKKVFYQARKYYENDNKDLYDLVSLTAKTDPAGPVGTAADALMKIISEKLVIANTSGVYNEPPGRKYTDDGSHGLAIYLPTSAYNYRYGDLAWAKDTKWDEFLKANVN